MLHDFEKQKEVLFQSKEDKDDGENRNFECNEAIRKDKEKLFHLE